MTRTHIHTSCIHASDVVAHVKKLIAQGNVTRLRIRDDHGHIALDMPMTVGIVAGGSMMLAAPWLTLLGGIAGLASNLHVEVERSERDPPHDDPDSVEDAPHGGNMPV